MRIGRAFATGIIGLGAFGASAAAAAAKEPPRPAPPPQRIVHAEVVALDHLLVYNRFGSFNPFGMIFALKRDVSNVAEVQRPTAELCGSLVGTEAGRGELTPGQVLLKTCKRPRPLVLRAMVGDILEVTVTNLLREKQPDISGAPPVPPVPPQIPTQFCREAPTGGDEPVRGDIRSQFEAGCREAQTPSPDDNDPADGTGDWPKTRFLSFVIPGLESVATADGKIDPACLGTGGVRPGHSFTCRWRMKGEGTHLFSSLAAPAGGQADGGSLMHGLFGALIVEPARSRAYRSQVTRAGFDKAWPKKSQGPQHARDGARVGYDSAADDSGAHLDTRPSRQPDNPCRAAAAIPVLAMIRDCGLDGDGKAHVEIVHGDINGIIVPQPLSGDEASPGDRPNEDEVTARNLRREQATPFREFTILFHDELKTFYPDQLKELDEFRQLSGVRDGFAINYGASGAGGIVIANRKKIGPAANCPECLYEEFFLQSWANGDPALLEAFSDDPSNVHHSYLNDKVVFRNLHAGKETHVFHLHSHQWFAGNDENRGSYLDSQTIAPQQGFTYRIYHGGLDRYRPKGDLDEDPSGWWENLGSGNRNRTPGDAIFHCHLYPHFAQGMWALWRVHDVLEDGTRLLPDGQRTAGLSFRPLEDKRPRIGSVTEDGRVVAAGAEGTPIPGLVPLPGYAAPVLPLYAQNEGDEAMPGYPFYIAGRPGHRAPQPPLDMATNTAYADAGLKQRIVDGGVTRSHLDGGLPRHIVTGGVAKPSVGDAPAAQLVPRMLALGDLTSKFESLDLQLLPQRGTKLEQGAMAFHHDGVVRRAGSERRLPLRDVTGKLIPAQSTGGYRSPAILGASAPALRSRFAVNGAPPAPGAPYADPCGVPSTLAGRRYRAFDGDDRFHARTFRAVGDPFQPYDLPGFINDPGMVAFQRFDVSAVQIDMVVNRAGWHDPQGRINVLSSVADQAKGAEKIATAAPFFFRSFSGGCVEFRHTNELPKDLELDDFQLRVPTDTIGQHIHLVKFDVTSADGSGNGFNYEDGTFAPDEILARICHSRGRVREGADTGSVANREEECRRLEQDPEGFKLYPRKRIEGGALGDARYFQTSVQRWFADPILSSDGEGTAADRTLRTVFTHDHFAPSNIQQHGFYSALLIEPRTHAFCLTPSPEGAEWPVRPAGSPPQACVNGPGAGTPTPVLASTPQMDHVGPRASVFSTAAKLGPYGDSLHPDSREYALAIADFALLYDGSSQAFPPTGSHTPQGLDRLVVEAQCRSVKPERDEKKVPAQAGGLCTGSTANPQHQGQVNKLAEVAAERRHRDGNPVDPPLRPEAISQEHHNPYLVNYRNEPIPLRVGSENGQTPSWAANRCGRVHSGHSEQSVRQQRQHAHGDLANVFRSFAEGVAHGDPCTPIMEAFQNERISLRLIQGAQEVQHLFRLDGGTFRRNTDQHFPSARPLVTDLVAGSRAERCHESPVARYGRPREYVAWLTGQDMAHPYWPAYQMLSAGCDNVLGFTTSQEVGISEHFELGAFFRGDTASTPGFLKSAESRQIVNAAEVQGAAAKLAALDRLEQPLLFDYRYSFGTQDADWNGAWGLVRVHAVPADPEDLPPAKDWTQCLHPLPGVVDAVDRCEAGAPPLAERLKPFPQLRREAKPQQSGGKGGKRSPEPPNSGIEAASPGKSHSDPALLRCPAGDADSPPSTRVRAIVAAYPWHRMSYNRADGLFDPDALLLIGVDPAEVAVGSRTAADLSADEFDAAGADMADSIRKAVEARVAAFGGATPAPFVLRVNAGDCVTIKLANLLTGQGGIEDERGDALMPKIVPLNTDAHQTGAKHEVRPSAKLALTLGAPLRMSASQVPLPFGLNRRGAIDRGQVLTYRFYAGQIWMGEEPMGGEATIEKAMPYAFGALPIHAASDVIGHPTSGLAGTLIVEPIQSTYDGRAVSGTSATLQMADGHAGMRSSLAVAMPGSNFPQGAVPPPFQCLPGQAGENCAPAPINIQSAVVREHVLLWQDGLNLWSSRWFGSDGSGPHPLPNCVTCGDSYDWGEQGVSYGTEPFTGRLVALGAAPQSLGLRHYPDDRANLNGFVFPPDFFAPRGRLPATPQLFASPGEQVMIRLAHPGGRARQHAFLLAGADYDDLFPGFGSGHSALLAPGKAFTAAFCAPLALDTYLWRTGPQHLFSRGMWGHLRIFPVPEGGPPVSRCAQ